jgi:dipeptidyl-peptidase-3
MMKTLAGDASWFEARMPWDDKYKKKESTLPSARAFELLGGFGDGGPVCPVGINLPNFQKLRETVGTKNFLLTNVLETGDEARTRTLFDEFIAAKEEREQALAFYKPRQLAMIALHEVTGHGSGKVSADLVGDPDKHLKEFASTLEEARADLVAHWFIGDPRLTELGVVSAGVTYEQEYTAMLAWSLIALRDVPDGDQFEEDHARAGHLIASYVIAKGGGELFSEGGKSYVRLTDVETAHRAVGELLSEIMRIKATGDYDAARKLVETYGIKFDPNLRDEVVSRARSLGLPERSAFAMPELELVQNKMGGVKDIQIVHPRDFKGQMLRFADH